MNTVSRKKKPVSKKSPAPRTCAEAENEAVRRLSLVTKTMRATSNRAGLIPGEALLTAFEGTLARIERLESALHVCRNALYFEHEAGTGNFSYALAEADNALISSDDL